MGHLIVNLFTEESDSVNWEAMGLPAPDAKDSAIIRRAIIKTIDIKHIQETDDPNVQKVVYYADLEIPSDYIQGSFADVCAAYIRAESEVGIQEPEEEEE